MPTCAMWSPKRKCCIKDTTHGLDLLTSASGLFAIKDYRDSINQDDFNKAVRKMAETKKLEGKLEYQKL